MHIIKEIRNRKEKDIGSLTSTEAIGTVAFVVGALRFRKLKIHNAQLLAQVIELKTRINNREWSNCRTW